MVRVVRLIRVFHLVRVFSLVRVFRSVRVFSLVRVVSLVSVFPEKKNPGKSGFAGSGYRFPDLCPWRCDGGPRPTYIHHLFR